MTSLTANRSDKAAEAAARLGRPVFGAGIDPVPAARKGGHASGISRRLRHQRQLEAKILESRNGAAAVKLLELKRADQAELLERQLAADRMVAELDRLAFDLREEIDKERERLSALLLEGDERRQEVEALEARRQALDSDTALDTLLSEIGEERATASAYRIGWGDDDVDETDVAS